MLFALGLQLMAEAENAARLAARITKEHALTYRDGLIIALLAAVPLRKRTFAALTINQHLVKVGSVWLLDIPAADTKTRRAMEFPIPDTLSEPIDLYLTKFRPAITGANEHQGLWPSAKGYPMCGGAIYDAVRQRTMEGLGLPVNLHRFRGAAGNLWSISDPMNVRGAKDLLGHTDFGTTERHYIGAQSRLAGRALTKVLRSPRQRVSPDQTRIQLVLPLFVWAMKIATFNVNNVNKRLANLIEWLGTARPDVACLQELKATESEFPVSAINKAGYSAVWRGQKSWNGVAILARGIKPIVTHTALPGDPADTQGRYIEAAVGGVLIASLYAPNGNPQPGPKFTYKLAWMKRLVAHAAVLYAVDAPVVLAGDYNVVPTDADIYPTKSYAKNALMQPEPRALFRTTARSGLGRRHPHAASRYADVHVLGLQAKPLAARCRPSHRSSAAESRSREAPRRFRCGS